MKTLLCLLICSTAACAADAPPSRIFFDDFQRADLSDAWKITHPAFAIENGVLKATQVKPSHSAVGMVKLGQKDVVIAFKFRLDGATGINAVCNDRNYKEGHGGHICRVSLSPKGIFLADDKERLRHDIEEMKKDPARKAEVAKRTAGMSRNFRVKLEPARWCDLTIKIVGEELRVSLDGNPIGSLKSPGIAHPTKTDFYFAVSGKDALFDDVSIRTIESP